MSVKVPITEEMVTEAIIEHDRMSCTERTDDEVWDDSVRGYLGQIGFEEALKSLYGDSVEIETVDSYEYDYEVETGERQLKMEIKTRDTYKLEEKGIDPDEADLPVRVRDGQYHSDRYVLGILHGWDYYELIGLVDQSTARTSDWADWTQWPTREVARSDIRPFPTA